jgi:hypothetical protein
LFLGSRIAMHAIAAAQRRTEPLVARCAKKTLTRRYLHCIAPLRGFTLSIAAPRERIATPKVTLR